MKTIFSDYKLRDSNFELLRIIAIFFVIVHHLVIKGVDSVGYVSTYSNNVDGIIGVWINSFVVVGVNLFVLISGWYGIKHITKGFIRLVVDCAVFGIISYFLLFFFTSHPFLLKECIISSLFTRNWFVVSYMMLLLIAPIIEESLKNVDIIKLKRWIFLLLIFNFFFSFYLGKVNDNGYNVVHFIFLYYIARYLRLSKDAKWNRNISKYGLFYYFFFSSLLSIIFILYARYNDPLKSIQWFGYNNPLLVASSLSLLLWFSSLKIQSACLNSFATCVFGVYVLHTTPFVVPVRNTITNQLFWQYGYSIIIIEALLIFLFCGFIALLFNIINGKISSEFYIHISRFTSKIVF